METQTQTAGPASMLFARAQLRAYVLDHIPELRRAADEGYPVYGHAVDHIVSRVASIEPAAFVLTEDTRAYRDAAWTERTSPRDDAFLVRDAVVAWCEHVERPSCVTLAVLRVQRFTERRVSADERTVSGRRFTAVLVTVATPVTPARVVVFPTEAVFR